MYFLSRSRSSSSSRAAGAAHSQPHPRPRSIDEQKAHGWFTCKNINYFLNNRYDYDYYDYYDMIVIWEKLHCSQPASQHKKKGLKKEKEKKKKHQGIFYLHIYPSIYIHRFWRNRPQYNIPVLTLCTDKERYN